MRKKYDEARLPMKPYHISNTVCVALEKANPSKGVDVIDANGEIIAAKSQQPTITMHFTRGDAHSNIDGGEKGALLHVPHPHHAVNASSNDFLPSQEKHRVSTWVLESKNIQQK